MIYYEWEVTEEDNVKEYLFSTVTYILEHFHKPDMDVELLIAYDDVIELLNKEYRKVDRTTDVLSFPNFESGLERISSGCLGSIAISYKRAKEQAEEYGHSFKREVCFLCTHGMLHLLGYDHMNPDDEKVMTETANAILSDLGIHRTNEE